MTPLSQASVSDDDPGSKTSKAASEVAISFDDNRMANIVLGRHDANIARIERKFDVVATANGNHVVLKGDSIATMKARHVLERLYAAARSGNLISLGDVDGAIEEELAQGSLFPEYARGGSVDFDRISTRKRGVIRARNQAQDLYIKLLSRCDLVFAEGPAGTGKTWLAVGFAVSLLEQGIVERLILSRPAVEAGEKLGFLPGDLRDKVDPFLRPVYDALYDFMDGRAVERGLQTGMIEVAPLAFMRGRTLTNACILLDEAQNATSMQMKMFLTRLGENSRMIATGDISQTDLPQSQVSGLKEAIDILAGIEGVGHISFKGSDVVRHDLVRRIVNAYERRSSRVLEGGA
jgi:phosphate starvation-inducible protein PhoH and related proteins